jgi:hypothetical protein
MSQEAMTLDEAFDSGEADYGQGEVDEMLEGIGDGSEAYLAERQRNPRRRGGPPSRGVPAATGGSAYRAPQAAAGYVTQAQLKEALARVGTDVKRNADGIKAINARVSDVVTVNRIQSQEIGKLDKRMKIDGVLDFVESYSGNNINAYLALKGAVKYGLLGEGKGALGNPLVIGGIGLLLRNPGILSGLTTTTNP